MLGIGFILKLKLENFLIDWMWGMYERSIENVFKDFDLNNWKDEVRIFINCDE